MTRTYLQEAKAEAERFLKRVEELEAYEAHQAKKPHYDPTGGRGWKSPLRQWEQEGQAHIVSAQAGRAAIRRASMDLTRALARIRKTGGM